jgi:uncharacterized protein YegL
MKKRGFKRGIAFLLAVIMVFSASEFPAGAFALAGTVIGQENAVPDESPSEEESSEEENTEDIENPAEDNNPIEEEKNEEGETPTESENPAESETPVESETPTEDETPAEGETPTEEEIPIEGETPAEGETPTESETPIEGEIPPVPEAPAEVENPFADMEFSIELMTDALYLLADQYGYDREIVDWLLYHSSEDFGYLEYIYGLIINEPETIPYFLEGVSERKYYYENPEASSQDPVYEEEESKDEENPEIAAAAEEFSMYIENIIAEREEEASEEKEGTEFYYPALFSTRLALFSLSPPEIKTTDMGDGQYIRKTVKKLDTFRHYQVDLELRAKKEITELPGKSLDIALIFDTSGSMEGTNLNGAKDAVKAFVNGFPTKEENGQQIFKDDVRISIISFNTNAEIKKELTNNPQQVINAIQNLSAAGGTNIQDGILKAKNSLGVNDGDNLNNSDRKKIMILLSDGEPTNIATDEWTYNEYQFDRNKHGFSKPSLYNSTKRWTYTSYAFTKTILWIFSTDYFEIKFGDRAFERQDIYRSDWFSPIAPIGSTTTALRQQVTLAEAQYAANQGIDLYTVAYTGNQNLKDLLEKMTYAMNGSPSFNSNLSDNVFKGGISLSDIPHYEGKRAFAANNTGDLKAIYAELQGEIFKNLISFTVEDTLEANFEFVEFAENTENDNEANGDDISVSENKITWETSLDNRFEGDYGTGRLSFIVKVIDADIWEKGAGLDGSAIEKQPLATSTSVEYTPTSSSEPATVYLEEQPIMPVDPLVNGTASVVLSSTKDPAEAILLGDAIDLIGTITNGNASFSYQWYNGDDPSPTEAIPNANGTIAFGYGNNLTIAIPNTAVEGLKPEGNSSYTLFIKDEKAAAAGYENERVLGVNIPVAVEVFEPKLTVKVQGGSSDIDGRFETRVIKTLENNHASSWYFMGLAEKTYTNNDNIERGTYSAEAYVPYGYKATGGEAVEIILTKDGNDDWTGYEKEITIEIEKDDPLFFFDWAWFGGSFINAVLFRWEG